MTAEEAEELLKRCGNYGMPLEYSDGFADGYNFSQQEVKTIIDTLKEYLTYKSADGTARKNELREELKKLTDMKT